MSVRDSFAAQGPTCVALGSPFMGRLMPLIGERLEAGTPVADRILNWSGDTSASGHSVPLRLAGALHALKIEGKALTEVYPPRAVSDDELWAAVSQVLVTHEERILAWLNLPPQTNEVRRAAVLLPALAMIGEVIDQPVELLELGTSAGLNLRFDRFWLETAQGGLGDPSSKVRLSPEWIGSAPTGCIPEVIARRGVDLNPLNPQMPEDRLRLLAYLWPDQPDRTARTKAAFEIADGLPADIQAGDAGAWTEAALGIPATDRVRVLFHTIAWQYFPDATKARALNAMKHTTSPLFQIGMEADGGKGASVTLTRWPDGTTQEIGRVSFHGLWVEWLGGG